MTRLYFSYAKIFNHFYLTISTYFLAPTKTNPRQHTRSPSGATTVTVPLAATINGAEGLVNAAIDELKAQFGVGHPDDLADIQMYYLPQGVINNAYALVETPVSVYGDMWYVYLSIVQQVISYPFSDPYFEHVPLLFVSGMGV